MQRARQAYGLSLVATALSFGLPQPAQAADEVVRACVAAHTEGQVQRGQGQLLAARRHFVACSQPRCPGVVRKECVTFADQVAGEIPSIVVVAKDSQGRDVNLASMILDASWSFDHDFGIALELDPGTHEIILRSADGRAQQQTFLLRAGERLRRVIIEFPDNPSTPAHQSQPQPRPQQTTSARHGILPYIIGGIGAVALGSFVGFALDGKAKERDLDRCKPSCTQAGVDRMRRSYLIADISLAVAVAAVGVDTYLILSTPTSTQGSFTLGALGRF
ncbi:MAG: hypothetical protein ACOY0T_35445 [Myxococcota bacterium]